MDLHWSRVRFPAAPPITAGQDHKSWPVFIPVNIRALDQCPDTDDAQGNPARAEIRGRRVPADPGRPGRTSLYRHSQRNRRRYLFEWSAKADQTDRRYRETPGNTNHSATRIRGRLVRPPVTGTPSCRCRDGKERDRGWGERLFAAWGRGAAQRGATHLLDRDSPVADCNSGQDHTEDESTDVREGRDTTATRF